MQLTHLSIALGICGGVAAYRSCDLIRELYRLGAKRVIPLMTPTAAQFVSPLTLQSLSREPVLQNELALNPQGTPLHIALAQETDVLLIHPATAHTIAKLAAGLADDMVTTAALSYTGKPLLIAPAMNTRMWQNPLTMRNIQTLSSLDNVSVIPPTTGHLACGETGEGHLSAQETILLHLYRVTHPYRNTYKGKRAIVTAGGTMEPIDTVRHITNRSSGKMGVALADELFAMGADVTLIATSAVSLTMSLAAKPYTVILADTFTEMHQALHTHFPDADLLLMAAAVSDFHPKAALTHKMKRSETPITLDLIPHEDILATLTAKKRNNQQIIGFAAESQNLMENAEEKLHRKGLDAIVINDISRSDIGFQTEENEVILLFSGGSRHFFPKTRKDRLAQQLLLSIPQYFNSMGENILPVSSEPSLLV